MACPQQPVDVPTAGHSVAAGSKITQANCSGWACIKASKEAMSLKADYPVLYFHDSVHSEALFIDKKNKRVFFCRDSVCENLLSDMLIAFMNSLVSSLF
jgi:hypothetical protein